MNKRTKNSDESDHGVKSFTLCTTAAISEWVRGTNVCCITKGSCQGLNAVWGQNETRWSSVGSRLVIENLDLERIHFHTIRVVTKIHFHTIRVVTSRVNWHTISWTAVFGRKAISFCKNRRLFCLLMLVWWAFDVYLACVLFVVCVCDNPVVPVISFVIVCKLSFYSNSICMRFHVVQDVLACV